jgi:hypothetical protein
MAAAAFGLAAALLLGTASAAPTVVLEVARPDPGAAQQLERLMRAGESGSWSVKYEFTRTLADGRVMRQSMQEARDATLHVLRSGSALNLDRGDRSYICNLAGSRFACTQSVAATALPPSEVLRVAVSAGAYSVTRAAAASIAAVRVRCFRVLATGHGQLPDLGLETDLCYTASGVPLQQRIVRASGGIDERVAVSVATHVTERTIEAMAPELDPARATGQN